MFDLNEHFRIKLEKSVAETENALKNVCAERELKSGADMLQSIMHLVLEMKLIELQIYFC
jgi:hypothetical protein